MYTQAITKLTSRMRHNVSKFANKGFMRAHFATVAEKGHSKVCISKPSISKIDISKIKISKM